MDVKQYVGASVNPAVLQPLREIDPQLVIVFAGPGHFGDSAMAEALAQAFPAARRIGVSTAGEIHGKGVSDNGIVVTAVHFERIRFVVAETELKDMNDSAGAGKRLAEQLLAPDLKAALVLSQGVDVNGSDVISGATSVLGRGVPLTGGLAADNGAFTRTHVLLDNVISDRKMLAVGLYGDAVLFSHGCFGGWQSFGPARQVTLAAGNVLHELDGRPALDIYKQYLGDYARDLPASGLLFPFALLQDDRQDSGIIRTLLAINEQEGSIVLAGDVPQGKFVRLMHASTEALVDGAEMAAKNACREHSQERHSLALLVSCIGRKLVMGDRIDEEIDSVAGVLGSHCTLAGFYSNGEISPCLDTGECKLHNQTMTITYLAEV